MSKYRGIQRPTIAIRKKEINLLILDWTLIIFVLKIKVKVKVNCKIILFFIELEIDSFFSLFLIIFKTKQNIVIMKQERMLWNYLRAEAFRSS